MQDEHSILFQLAAPNTADPHYAAALSDLLGVNTRNVVLMLVYFAVLLAVAAGMLQWLTRGFTHWRLAPLGWGVVACFALVTMVPLWRLYAEEGPRMAYTKGRLATLQVARGVVIAQGFGVSKGRPMPMRKLQWSSQQPPAEGETPYLPEIVTLLAPPGTGVWLGVGVGEPIFLGFATAPGERRRAVGGQVDEAIKRLNELGVPATGAEPK